MKRKILSTCILIFFVSISSIFSQENENVEDSYLEYFKLPRESLFLHTNKTIYLTIDDIWFKAYAYDRKNNLSSKSTTNIYMGLYDKDGTQLAKKLYLARNGAAVGHFKIDSTLPSGEYFLKVSTNWMKNFKEDDSYVQKIQIVNPKIKGEESKKTSTKEYDFQFLPEGGHILVDVKNSVGIKVIDDTGKGTVASGVILNSANEEVAKFKSNRLGIGKFTFTPKTGESYSAKVSLDNGKDFTQGLPVIKDIGVAIMVNNMRSDKTIVTLSVNQASLDLFKDENFKLLLHKDGKVKPIPVKFDKALKLIVIANKDLFKGVNTVTLFNEKNQPLLERMFFNSVGTIKDYKLFLTKTGGDSDSITYKLRSQADLGQNILNTSISVLPSETVSYDPDHSIVSALYLKPYLKGVIEKPQYYFKNLNRKKQFELDALLVTQGWSRYSWDNIFNFPPVPKFDFENGISINGFVNKNTQKITSLFLYPTKLNGSTFLDIDKDGKFNLKNFYPQANEEIQFSYLNKKGKMKKPNMNLSFIKFMGTDNVNTNDYQSFLSYYNDKNEVPEQFVYDDSYEELEEIKIKTDYKEKLIEESRDPILVNGKVTKITDEIVLRYRNILDLIQNSGFDVIQGDGVITRLGSVIIRSRTRGSQGNPAIFLDDILVNNIDFLTTMTTDQVERIVIDRTGVGLGISANNQNFGGAIKIYSRRSILGLNSGVGNYNNTFFSTKSDYGFEPVKEFYIPKYASYRISAFRDYGVIYWNPNLNVQSGTSDSFTMVNTNLDEINFYVEGISTDGTVFSQLIKLDNSKKP